MYPNMYQFQQNFQPQGNQLIRVTGIEGARAYQMNANSTVALFDSGSDVMYIKSTDGAGFPTIRTFTFEEVRPATVPTVNDYVSRAEFEELKKELNEYGKQFISGSNESEQNELERTGRNNKKQQSRSTVSTDV